MITQLDSHKFATHHEMKKITQKSLVKTFHSNLFAMAIIAYLIRDQYFYTMDHQRRNGTDKDWADKISVFK